MTIPKKMSRRPKSVSEVRKDAEQYLASLKIAQPPIPVEKIAALMGAQIQYVPFDGELAGMLVRKEGEIFIGVNSLHHANRQRFTVAHELGHLCYHEGEVHVDRKLQLNRRDQTSSLAIDPDEIEANRFAAELLMPFKMLVVDLEARAIDIEDDAEIKFLAERYQVSTQAMTHRITNVLMAIIEQR
jgi:Zn-dependent peptidase ImmA (M78 family)